MAYQAKKHKQFREDFELVNEDGEVEHTLHVAIDADSMVVNINRKYCALVRAMNETSEVKRKAENAEEISGCIDTLGRAVVDLLEAVFGAEDAKTIVDFYANRYVEMSQEVLPFINQVVIPRMIEIRNKNKKATINKYNRKQRHAILNGLR